MKTIDIGKFTWIDVPRPTRADLDILARKYPFHQLNLDDCLSKIQLSKMDRYQEHSFLVLRFPSITHNSNGLSVTVKQISVFVGAGYIVTVHQDEFDSLSSLFQSCNNDTQRQILMDRSPAYLLYKIIDTMVDDLLNALIHLEGDLDAIEDIVFDGKISASKQISTLRREITTLRRTVIPLRRVLSDLSLEMQKFTDKGEDIVPYYSDVKDHIEKVLEELEASKETVEIYKDTDFMTSTEKSNKILGVLTIFFTLTIPVAIISSFYGMNIEIPGTVQSGPWTFLGFYTTVIFVIVISIIPSLLMLWYFYRRNWMSF